MKESGSGLPQFQTVKAPRLPTGEAQIPSVTPGAVPQKALLFLMAGVLVALALIGYLVYALFFAGAGQKPVSEEPVQSVTGGQSAEPAPSAPTALTHQSVFKKPVDQKIPLVLSPAVTSASDLQTYVQKFQNALSRVSLTAKFVEVEPSGDDGKGLGVADVLSAADGFVLDSDFLAGHFSPDLTIFAYRESGNFWPGYIFTLKPDENWLFLKSEVSKLEASQNILNLFLNSPEGHGEFYDGEIASQPVRISDFASGARFVYGWVRGYLVLSTSYAGFAEAVSRL